MRFSNVEKRFVQRNEVGKLATVGPHGIPHIVPVCYIYKAETFWVATDYATRKYRNLLKSDGVALLIDEGFYSSRGLLVQGRSRIIEKGAEFLKIYAVFFKKFDWVRADPWKENEAPFIRIDPMRKVSWGL
jgi:nitroimidazol reductase NimA-like FMN-containing flavoprotein (pyridoxamine 5'-phosphate oxidase superfamily)